MGAFRGRGVSDSFWWPSGEDHGSNYHKSTYGYLPCWEDRQRDVVLDEPERYDALSGIRFLDTRVSPLVDSWDARLRVLLDHGSDEKLRIGDEIVETELAIYLIWRGRRR